MIRRRPDQGWRASALAVALLAITLNFFQPLAHAVLMRDGGPEAAARTWGVFCLPAEIDPAWAGELPRTLLIDRDGKETVLTGVADLAEVRAWLDAQKKR